jgi:glycosyltransferase involved in cell wall biosynthesis
MFTRCGSIENVCTQFSQQLISAVKQVALHNYNGRSFFDASLSSFAYLNKAAPIAVFYGTPDFTPTFLFNHETTIGGFVCETDKIPQRWVHKCNRFDLILVPSRFCKLAFERSGVTVPIGITPHGLETDYHPLPGKTRQLPFVFFNTVNSHVPGRKGLRELLRSFLRAFSDRSDVILRLRMKRSKPVDKILEEFKLSPQVWIDEVDDSSTAEFAAIYSEVHCTVHPSNGEGFGLIPLQSIACETPVIAPQSTGMADYLSAENAMLLRTNGLMDVVDVYY